MHENVRGWCSDWFGEYLLGEVTDPSGSSSGSVRVIRGGGWNFTAVDCRLSSRGRSVPSNLSDGDGFCMCLGPSGKKAEPMQVSELLKRKRDGARRSRI